MKYLLISSFFFMLFSSSVFATDKITSEEKDFHTLLSSLLKINQNKFTYLDQNGITQPDSLKMFKELERIYIKNIEEDLGGKKFSPKRLKMIMYFSFYSHANNSAAFQEYLATDLMPIYIENQDGFLQILKELPFLIQSNCDRLNAYFVHKKNEDYKKSSFVTSFKKKLSQYLNDGQVDRCITYFDH